MSLASALGLSSGKKVRYAIVGLGDIAQEAMLPGVSHTGNSEVVGLRHRRPGEGPRLGEQYGVDRQLRLRRSSTSCSHSGTIDAIYLATPNWRHAEFAIPALKAGIHVLVEKPLEVSAAKCREIIEAQKAPRRPS